MSVTPMKPEPPTPNEKALGLDDLTAAETAAAERQAAQSVTTLGNERFPQAGLVGALGWVLARRRDPRLTYASYMETRTLGDIATELGLSDDDADTDAGKDSGSTSPK